MASYEIGAFGFVRWDGMPPQLVTQHIATFNKIGQTGITLQATGLYGDPFEVTTMAVFETQTLANSAAYSYRALMTAVPQFVIHNDINYSTTYSHRYSVLDARPERIRRAANLIGADYEYTGGFLVMAKWKLIPIDIS